MLNSLKPSARVYDRITDAIVRRRLVPGAFVTQRELVEISEMPLGSVREAIPRLEADGIFTSTRQRGLQIASISPSFIRNAYQLRIALEKEAFGALLEHMSDESIEEMRRQHQEILDDLTDDVSDELLERAQHTDWELHDRAIDFLHNDVISEVYRINTVKIRMAIQPQLRITAGNLLRVMNEHMAIIDGMAKRDTGRTMEALERHLRNSKALALGQEVERRR
ncbi:GntR family transcriptional regulator [Mesorhizobium sp. ASY16-5R]|uniref:GntR family transcriptional regulator n=1 Tax=Mesorhizobium sp. ASY16-5R TaxID=3445772 RepID=UPI003F9F4D0A